jgi:hypothetical protein
VCVPATDPVATVPGEVAPSSQVQVAEVAPVPGWVYVALAATAVPTAAGVAGTVTPETVGATFAIATAAVSVPICPWTSVARTPMVPE